MNGMNAYLHRRARRRADAHRYPSMPDTFRRTERLVLTAISQTSAQFSFWVVDGDYRYVYFNDTHRVFMEEFWGVAIAVGDPVLDLIPDATYRERTRSAYTRATTTRTVLPASAARDHNGILRFFHTVLHPLPRSRTGTPRGIAAFSVEVSELEYIRASRDALRRELDHRVFNNLQTIVSLLQLDLADIREPAARNAIESATGRVATLGLTYEAEAELSDDERDPRIGLHMLFTHVVQMVTELKDPHHRVSVIRHLEPVHHSVTAAAPLALLVQEAVALCFGDTAERRPDELEITTTGAGTTDGGVLTVLARPAPPLPAAPEVALLLANQAGARIEPISTNDFTIAGYRIVLPRD